MACETSWDPEFEPSVEEIVDYPMMYGDSLSSLSLASSLSGGVSLFSCAHGRSRSTGSSRAPQYYTRIRSMRSLSMCPSSNYGDVFMRDSGCSLSCSLYPQ